MKAIITGGEGFIGKALSVALKERGAEVVSVDRLIGIEAGEYFTTASMDGVDVVFHLAAQTSVFNPNKSDIIRDNMEVFKTVAETCMRNAIKFVYASSSTAEPGNATSIYGLSKRFDEDYASLYIPFSTGVRFHNVYGPDPRHGTLLWHLLNDRCVKLYNNGENERHFTHISDIVDALLFGKSTVRNIVNAANPEKVTTLQFAEEVAKYNHVEIELVKEKRRFDREAQEVNEGIFTVSLQYKSVAEGVRSLFDGKM